MLQPKDIDWLNIQKQDLYMLSTSDPLQTQGHIQTEGEGMEKDIPCKWNQKKAGVAILISGKIDFKTKTITRE